MIILKMVLVKKKYYNCNLIRYFPLRTYEMKYIFSFSYNTQTEKSIIMLFNFKRELT